jgi:hypothetical protein
MHANGCQFPGNANDLGGEFPVARAGNFLALAANSRKASGVSLAWTGALVLAGSLIASFEPKPSPGAWLQSWLPDRLKAGLYKRMKSSSWRDLPPQCTLR